MKTIIKQYCINKSPIKYFLGLNERAIRDVELAAYLVVTRIMLALKVEGGLFRSMSRIASRVVMRCSVSLA